MIKTRKPSRIEIKLEWSQWGMPISIHKHPAVLYIRFLFIRFEFWFGYSYYDYTEWNKFNHKFYEDMSETADQIGEMIVKKLGGDPSQYAKEMDDDSISPNRRISTSFASSVHFDPVYSGIYLFYETMTH